MPTLMGGIRMTGWCWAGPVVVIDPAPNSAPSDFLPQVYPFAVVSRLRSGFLRYRRCTPTCSAGAPGSLTSSQARRIHGARRTPSSATGLCLQLVPEPPNGGQVSRGGRIGLDFRAQPFDVNVQGLGIADVIRTPDAVDQLTPGEHPAGVANQVFQQVELLERQRRLLAVHVHHMS